MRILTTTLEGGGSIHLRTITRFMKSDDNIQDAIMCVIRWFLQSVVFYQNPESN